MRVWCEKYKATISQETCLVRQKPGSLFKNAADPICAKCTEGKRIIDISNIETELLGLQAQLEVCFNAIRALREGA